jgi:hypothetical protein
MKLFFNHPFISRKKILDLKFLLFGPKIRLDTLMFSPSPSFLIGLFSLRLFFRNALSFVPRILLMRLVLDKTKSFEILIFYVKW